jgi:hypothetical protein
LLNSTWSNFVITDRTIDRLGGFDPGFPGIGFEVMDYTARAGPAGESISNAFCPYITHKHRQPKATSFDSVSDRVWGKYTSAHQAFFSVNGKPALPMRACSSSRSLPTSNRSASSSRFLCCGLFRRAPAERSPSTRIDPELPIQQISS